MYGANRIDRIVTLEERQFYRLCQVPTLEHLFTLHECFVTAPIRISKFHLEYVCCLRKSLD